MDWSWDHLRFFLALARGGKLQRAADRLGVSHTTVLRRIRSFEEQLQTKLFDRTPDGWALSVAGERLLAEVEKMEVALGTISREIVGADQRIEGPVVLTTVGLVAGMVLPPLICRLKDRYPDIDLHLRIGQENADLSRREADIAIRITRHPHPTLVGRRLGSVSAVACAAPSYLERRPADHFPEDLDGHHFIVDSTHPDLGQGWLTSLIGTPRVTGVNCFAAAFGLCAAGLGIAILPSFVAQVGGLVPLPSPPADPVPVWLLTHPDLRQVARIRAVMALLGDELEAVFAPPQQPGTLAGSAYQSPESPRYNGNSPNTPWSPSRST